VPVEGKRDRTGWDCAAGGGGKNQIRKNKRGTTREKGK
jgi:hypothetical protein